MIPASKVLSYPGGCYELAHTWNPSCFKAWLDIGIPGMTEAAKVYLPLFMISSLCRSKKLDVVTLQTIARETVQSSAFVGANCYFFLASFCMLRRCLPFLPARIATILATTLGSYLAIFIERESRRSTLTVYMTNVAAEAVFNALQDRNIVPHIQQGQKLLAAITISSIFYLHKAGMCEGLLGQLTRALLGRTETCSPSTSTEKLTAGAKILTYITCLIKGKAHTSSLGGKYAQTQGCNNEGKNVLDGESMPTQAGHHPSCSHCGSCRMYACHGFCESLVLGLVLQAALTGGSGLLRLITTGRRPPTPSPQTLLGLGFCLSSVTGLFRLVSCLLRRVRGQDSAVHALVAGAVASAGLRFYSSPSLMLYLFWKMVEAWCLHGAAVGILPRAPGVIPLLYALSTGVVLSMTVLEPHQISVHYRRFLRKMTDGHVAEMNWPMIANMCSANTMQLEELRNYKPRFDGADVRVASLPLLRELDQLR